MSEVLQKTSRERLQVALEEFIELAQKLRSASHELDVCTEIFLREIMVDSREAARKALALSE